MSYIVFDIETVPDTDRFSPPQEGVFPAPHKHRIVAIGRAQLDKECKLQRFSCPSGEDEAELLRGFGKAVAHYGKEADLVSWNGRGFDLPCIIARSLLHKIPQPWYFRTGLRKRYGANGHIDLMDTISEYGASKPMSLHDAATLCAVPGKVDHGSNVPQLVESKQWAELRWYCLNDVRITAIMLTRWRLLNGTLTPEQLAESEQAWMQWYEHEAR